MSRSSRRPRAGTTDTSPTAGTAGDSTRRPSTGPSGTPRAGRRERVRTYDRESFLERNRNRLIWLAGVTAVALIGAFVFVSAGQPAFACSTEFNPSASPAASDGRLGYVQQDMGRSHTLQSPQRYLYCPPASGPHSNTFGPMKPGVYGPDSGAIPQGWIHNLEHGGLAVLYSCTAGTNACTDAGQREFQNFYSNFPNSPICNFPPGTTGPVVARFDEMPYPYAALIWGRVLPLQSFDTATILKFFDTEGERTNPENTCPDKPRDGSSPSASPAASGEASPAASGEASPAASGEASPAASPSAEASPSAS